MYDIFNWTNDVNIMEVSLYFKKQKIIFRNKQQMNIIIFITRQSKLLSYSKYVTLNFFKQDNLIIRYHNRDNIKLLR